MNWRTHLTADEAEEIEQLDGWLRSNAKERRGYSQEVRLIRQRCIARQRRSSSAG